MFIDSRFGCATIPMVHREIFKTQKFKTKYPWREDYREKIVTLGNIALRTETVDMNMSIINMMVSSGVENTKTGRLIDLSPTDKQIIACAAAHRYDITSGDGNLVNFAEKQFDISNVYPLGLINNWIEEGIIGWDMHMQMVIEDWDKCKEMKQPIAEVGRYQTMTGRFYVGP